MTSKALLKSISLAALNTLNNLNNGSLDIAEAKDFVNKVSEQLRLIAVTFKALEKSPKNIDKVVTDLETTLAYAKILQKTYADAELSSDEKAVIRKNCNKIAENMHSVSQVINRTGLGFAESKIVIEALHEWAQGNPTPETYKQIFRTPK